MADLNSRESFGNSLMVLHYMLLCNESSLLSLKKVLREKRSNETHVFPDGEGGSGGCLLSLFWSKMT